MASFTTCTSVTGQQVLLVPILKCGVRTQLQTTCVFQIIYEKRSTNEIFPMDLPKSLKELFEIIYLSTDSCKWPGAPSRGALDHLDALLAEPATSLLVSARSPRL